MGEPRVDVVRRLWGRFEAAGIDALVEAVDWPVEWRPYAASGRVFRTPEELRAYVRGIRASGEEQEPHMASVEELGGSVLVHGTLRRRRGSQISDANLVWTYCFDAAGRLRRVAGFGSREAALDDVRRFAARERIAEEAPGATVEEGPGDAVTVHLRGELDIAALAILDTALGQAEARGGDVTVDLARTRFVERRVTAALLRARERAAGAGRRFELRAAAPAVARTLAAAA